MQWESRYYVVALVHPQFCNMSTYKQIREIFNKGNDMLINEEGYCEKSKEYTLLVNLFWQAINIMHCVNDNGNKFVKHCTYSLLNTSQSKNVGLVEKKANQI